MLNDNPQPFVRLHDLRIAEMAGFDYIFAPFWLCDELKTFKEMQSFLLDAQAIIGTIPERTIFIRFDDTSENMELHRFDLDWAGELLLQCNRQPLNDTPQYEFIKMLLEHSELLAS